MASLSEPWGLRPAYAVMLHWEQSPGPRLSPRVWLEWPLLSVMLWAVSVVPMARWTRIWQAV